MTTVEISKDRKGAYRQVLCTGHAGYGKKTLFRNEPDILCAAISVLVIGTANALDELAEEEIVVISNEEEGLIRIIFQEDTALQEKSVFLLDAMVFNLMNLSKEYGEKYLKVKFKEV